MNQAILSLLVANSFGVLNKVTGLFGRRGYNIKSLSVGETADPRFSRITIVTVGDEQKIEQIYRQVLKLEDVKNAALLPADSLMQRELILLKVRPSADQTEYLKQLAETFYAYLDQEGEDYVIIEAVGKPSRVDSLIEQARSLNIVELSRTGVTALERSPYALRDKA